MDEQYGLGSTATVAAPDAETMPTMAPEAPASDVSQPAESSPASPTPADPSTAPVPAGGGQAPPQYAPSAPAPPPVWQQQLQQVQQLDAALQWQEQAARQQVQQSLGVPGLSPEQAAYITAQYQQEAQARAEARGQLATSQQQLAVQAERAQLEGPAREIVLHRLVTLAAQAAPGIDQADMQRRLERIKDGEHMLIRAREYVDDFRDGTLKQRAQQGTDDMGPSSAAPPPGKELSAQEAFAMEIRNSQRRGGRR